MVLRRCPVRTVEGRVQGGSTNAFEIICCDCGDHPDRDYRDVSPRFQQIRGPDPIAAGVTAYEEHLKAVPQAGESLLAQGLLVGTPVRLTCPGPSRRGWSR